MADRPHQSQQQSTSTADELRALLRLGVPIALTQFGMTTLTVVDVAMLGRYRPEALPAMALGNTLSWAALVFCFGMMTALDPLLSQAVGARDAAAVTRTLLRGVVLGALLSVPAALLLLPADTWLVWLGQKPELVGDAARYARINTLGFLPFLWFGLCRSLLSAHSRTAPQVAVIVVANGLNAVCDYAWIFGRLGFHEHGVDGAAWATVTCRWAMFLGIAALSRRELWPHLRSFGDAALRRSAIALRPLLRLLRLGLPIGAQFSLEMGLFAATALLIGTLDAAAGTAEAGGPRLGGHQVTIQLASLSFMLPLGLGIAASVRVGWAVGRGDPAGSRRAAHVALLLGAGVMTAFMALFLLLPGPLAAAMTDDSATVAWAAALIPIAGVFQIGDGLQVVAVGCLRGVGDVRSPLWINVAGFWLLALPLGCFLAFPWGADLGPAGLWWGLVAGLFAVAAALLVAVRLRFAEQRERLSVD